MAVRLPLRVLGQAPVAAEILLGDVEDLEAHVDVVEGGLALHLLENVLSGPEIHEIMKPTLWLLCAWGTTSSIGKASTCKASVTGFVASHKKARPLFALLLL